MGLTLMVAMEDADAMIVCDSAWLGEAPGAFKLFEGAEMDHFLRTRGRNPHDIGLDDVMDGLRLRGAVPEKRALIGIQPEILTVGEHMTAAVGASRGAGEADRRRPDGTLNKFIKLDTCILLMQIKSP
jgi:hydrogenase maturation protease